jgi:hypothetical protein
MDFSFFIEWVGASPVSLAKVGGWVSGNTSESLRCGSFRTIGLTAGSESFRGSSGIISKGFGFGFGAGFGLDGRLRIEKGHQDKDNSVPFILISTFQENLLFFHLHGGLLRRLEVGYPAKVFYSQHLQCLVSAKSSAHDLSLPQTEIVIACDAFNDRVSSHATGSRPNASHGAVGVVVITA